MVGVNTDMQPQRSSLIKHMPLSQREAGLRMKHNVEQRIEMSLALLPSLTRKPEYVCSRVQKVALCCTSKVLKL